MKQFTDTTFKIRPSFFNTVKSLNNKMLQFILEKPRKYNLI